MPEQRRPGRQSPERGIDDAVRLLLSRPATLGAVRLGVVDGPSGSGKSTFAQRWVDALTGNGTVNLFSSDLLATWLDPFSWWRRFDDGVLRPLAAGQTPVITEELEPPVFVPETLSGMELLDHFRSNTAQLVFVVDEYGAVQGVITLRDVLEAITGEFGTDSADDAWAVRREDGSWLMDGLIPVPEIKDRLEIKELPEEDRGRYNTLAGMIMLLLGRLPRTTDTVEWGDWRFEVVDLDGKRVDKVLVSRNPSPGDNE